MVSVATPLVRLYAVRPAAMRCTHGCVPLCTHVHRSSVLARRPPLSLATAFVPAGRIRPRLRRAITHDASALHRRHL
eukprot:scaffold78101_cov60-Phaeocystis_antarctica.AAC.1